jgi:GNAT superfamily N-acetyltransferase
VSDRARSPAITIVGAEQLPDLAALEGVAEAVFGRGRRQPGWFERKLIREGVEAQLSSLAVAHERIHGYVLLGRAPSLGVIARGAGIGVVRRSRGRGLGRALLEHAIARARAAGCEAIEFLAEPARVGWYLAQDFAILDEQLTLLALGTGEPGATLNRGDEPPPRAEAPALWSWIPEVWERTPAPERAFTEIGGARMWLSREGRAWLVQRCELDDPAALNPCLTALRRRLAPTTPLLLYPCPAASAWTDALLRTGFDAAQRSFVVRREVV